MDNLNNEWKRARQDIDAGVAPATDKLFQAKAQKQSVLSFHYGNIIVLSVVLVGISLFFFYIAPFKGTLGRTGVALMLGGLIIRIIVELFSAIKYSRIRLEEDALRTTSRSLEFYQFRQKIHGPVTIITVGLYVISFYMLTPEFSLYFSTGWMLAMDIGFIIIAIILFIQIRKGVRKEMVTLQKLSVLQRDIETGQ
ncbi:hypothetical protein ACX0G7_21725 [Flavitalea antarctica]